MRSNGTSRIKAQILAKDPNRFVSEIFQANPDPWQEEDLSKLASHNRMGWKACKGPGKTAFLAWAAWWYLTCFPKPKIAATSISWDNLRDNLWTEMAKWQNKSKLLTSMFTWTKERIFHNESPEEWWMSARTWPKSADATQQGNTLAGTHAEYVMFILDEVGGIPDAVMAAAEAGLATDHSGKNVRS